MTARGRFITLEGGEGGGKSTQQTLLIEALSKAGITSVATREPGGSHGAEAIRALLVTGDPARWSGFTETLLHYAARHDHVTRLIAPALASGTWVVSDRFADSTMAYQGFGQAVARDTIRALHRLTLGDFQPDLTLILDLDPATGIDRARARLRAGGQGEDRYERMDMSFHHALRAGFRQIAEAEPDRCVLIDADRSIKAVHDDICAAVTNRLGVDLA